MGSDDGDSDYVRSNSYTVAVIVPIWGPPELTDACLIALDKTTYPCSIILVDNTSIYQSPIDVHAIVRNKENLGWAGGCNAGAKVAKRFDILCFVNCDTEAEPEWLAELMTAFEDDAVGVAGARLHYPDGSIQHSGMTIRRQQGGVFAENRKDEHPTEDVDGVTGACMAVRRSVFDALGGFDEAFWNGADDTSFCIAASERPTRIRYVSTSRLMHRESATDNVERWRRCYENVAILNQKWGL